MSSSYISQWWNRLTGRGYFALGLVVGVLTFALILITLEISSPIIDPVSQDLGNSGEEVLRSEYEQRTKPDVFFWPRKFLSLEDTVAQWVMMIFTVFAAYFLWRTLTVTREMAEVTRDIGQAQTRAYIKASKAVIETGGYFSSSNPIDEDFCVMVTVFIGNSGQSPALWYEVEGRIFSCDMDTLDEVSSFPIQANRWGGLPSKGESSFPLYQDGASNYLQSIATKERQAIFVSGQVTYETVFHEIITEKFEFTTTTQSLSEYLLSDDPKIPPLSMTRPEVRAEPLPAKR